ncbi:hypothetical protein BpHYR1_027975 [Brachionus plicatilis]|uniref:Uncharacterized protein n=1 Tax=Brachionus plicatilis TaxID=10195 RepID=A0A3M7RKC6_BRAPC|nr:hypothetical protein BpHYR1_027975 [Brachionus plicatilis]
MVKKLNRNFTLSSEMYLHKAFLSERFSSYMKFDHLNLFWFTFTPQTREGKLIAQYVNYGSSYRLDRVGIGTDKQINK